MNTAKEVMEIIKELSGIDTFTAESSLKEDLSLDSLKMVILLIELEDRCHIEFAESDMNPFDLTTVDDVINMVNKYHENI